MSRPTYYCVAFVHNDRISGWLSCTKNKAKAEAHLAKLKERGHKNIRILSRSKPVRGVKAP